MEIMSEELKEAYITTIDDLEIAIRSCGLFEFKQINEYRKLIKEYESKLSNVTENNTHTSNHSCQDGNQCDVCDQMIIDEFS